MQKSIVLTLLLTFTVYSYSQNKPAYKLFNSKGHKISYKKVIKKMKRADIVLFGELHNNPIVHWLQYELTKDIAVGQDLVLGSEMLEADNQKALNDYLEGAVNQQALDTLARLSKNYQTDYKPLVDLAKNHKIPFIATNIPRRFAKKVFRTGLESLDSLSMEEKSWMAPLPLKYDASLSQYVKMKAMMGGHGGDNLPKAQACKDATMAYFILKNKGNSLFIHYNGAYHSDYHEGIYWYLKQANPQLKILTITVEEQASIKKFNKEIKGKADVIIVTPTSMTKTY
ncbi:MAG: iron-regulated protein [Flavobacteriaceae bacterium]|nr:MAG: iron-regulated protein [Flavobacteriaceae bacterium]PCI35470.1 MAG: iron-regulated protein [Flavobacteriaceae bacterium]